MGAILYTTNTGSTDRYAKLLSHETGLPACSLAEAKKKVYPGTEVIYLGWIMASSVKGYADAAKHYKVCAVCAVGMGQTGTQTDVVRKKNHIPANVPLFTLQGNFDVSKLHGVYRLDRFYTVETACHASGLGLSIAKLLTEQMGGSVTANYYDGMLSISVSFP